MKMERETCAFNHGNECGVLTRQTCYGCSFFKTKERLDDSREKSRRRLNSLPDEQKTQIGIKYHIPELIPVAITDEQEGKDK